MKKAGIVIIGFVACLWVGFYWFVKKGRWLLRSDRQKGPYCSHIAAIHGSLTFRLIKPIEGLYSGRELTFTLGTCLHEDSLNFNQKQSFECLPTRDVPSYSI